MTKDKVTVVKKTTTKSKKNKQHKTTKIINVKKTWSRHLSKGGPRATSQLGTCCNMANFLTAPDLYGPIRIPRFGGSSSTVMCLDRTIVQLVGSGTNLIQGVGMTTAYSIAAGSQLTAANGATAFTTTVINPGSQFPSPSSLDDISIVAACMTICYTGSVMNAQGEMIIGVVSGDQTNYNTMNYNSLLYYPSFIRVPISSLINKPLRVFMTKNSAQANNFIATNSQINDCMRPFVVTANLPATQTVSIEITRTWEAHSTANATYNSPYVSTEGGYSQDLFKFQDLQQDMSTVAMPIEDYYSDYASSIAKHFTNSALSALSQGAGAMVGGHIANQYLRSIQGRAGNAPFLMN